MKRLPPLAELELIADQLFSTDDNATIGRLLEQLVDLYDLINFNFSYSKSIYRARKCDSNQPFANISEIYSPPVELAIAGRLNDDRQPMLYLSLNQFSTFEEIGAEDKNYLHLVTFEQTKPLRCGIIGEVTNVARWGQAKTSPSITEHVNNKLAKMKYNTSSKFLYLDSLLADIINQKHAQQTNYLLSRTLSSIIFKKFPYLDAIVYPSLALDGAFNLAVKPISAEQSLRLSAHMLILIRKRFRYGLYDFEVVDMAKGHWPDGTLDWGANNFFHSQ